MENILYCDLICKYFDQIFTFNILLCGTILLFLHSFLIHLHLYFNNELSKYYLKIKNDELFFSEFITNNFIIAIIEQSIFVVYLSEYLSISEISNNFIRIFISIIYSIIHTILFNSFYKYQTILLQLVNSFCMMMIYLRTEILLALMLNIYYNFLWVIISCVVYKFLFFNKFDNNLVDRDK